MPSLPSADEIRGELELTTLHPPLAAAERDVAEAQGGLEAARERFADLEREVASLPERIHRGEVASSALARTMAARDDSALAIAPAERALGDACVRRATEQRTAEASFDRELERRVAELCAIADAIAPFLDELRALDHALAQLASGGDAWRVTTGIAWPACARDAAAFASAKGVIDLPARQAAGLAPKQFND